LKDLSPVGSTALRRRIRNGQVKRGRHSSALRGSEQLNEFLAVLHKHPPHQWGVAKVKEPRLLEEAKTHIRRAHGAIRPRTVQERSICPWRRENDGVGTDLVFGDDQVVGQGWVDARDDL
jgi:hypothetical protein